ncbi:hypothetical protein MAPG_02633 [Magnaporthiopsis poae ATCC 64411]|uniref:WIBG Mago-binding domain-containing protein n=1 Tax=Magnaporthiopsis poae (strain ATCC 64411 / 73-15) TaxID=644358 RepID=A0A0C4CSC4_MAGP6|nr:hypothetical protein, variant [Magnaporthiopsis poae ATCC 64411]KLU83580.1 hypothetical protein MAPG_02633 [Magnaporthiopsis poae ATCC 64411]
MPSEAAPSVSGIVTDDNGQRHIPESTRADGSTRKAIKIRPGYRPPEDVELYKNRTAEAFRNRGKNAGIPGAEGLKDGTPAAAGGASSTANSNKNAKRREARKKAKAAAEDGSTTPAPSTAAAAGKDEAIAAAEAGGEVPDAAAQSRETNPEVEKEKKVRNLKKKLKQARELEQKKEDGGSLLPEQIAKVIKINELVRELQALGIDTSGDTKDSTSGPANEK